MQTHLDSKQTINLGSFYTPRNIVNKAYAMLEARVNLKDFLLFDSSCGYGDFFIQYDECLNKADSNNKDYIDTDYSHIDSNHTLSNKPIKAYFNNTHYGDVNIGNKDFIKKDSSKVDSKIYRYLGADIDSIALQRVAKNIRTLQTNSLENVSRKKFGIKENERLIIIGNPPYNDKTSMIRNGIKQELYAIDSILKHRDIGISFLRSYAVLEPDFVCVLHPLSYLIKKANFTALKDFKDKYRLIDSVLVSSENFSNAKTYFPIIIALYKRDSQGMEYEFIKSYRFKTMENKSLRLKDFDFITHYINKYPNPHDKRKEVAYFHTLRDINALKRNKTFVEKPSKHTIRIFRENLKYYYYIHHFKSFAYRLPYYFGNLDVFIDNEKFLESADDFMSLESNPSIEAYFMKLFEEYM